MSPFTVYYIDLINRQIFDLIKNIFI
ncbi:MAG: hypothetical protein, partial [Bacteriophage sp.]